MSWLDRTALLIGEESMEKLKNSTVAIVGLGGVGGSAAEAICRMGVGRLILIDNDDVDDTNRNRQLFATAETVGMDKVDAAAMRLRAINPDAELIQWASAVDDHILSLAGASNSNLGTGGMLTKLEAARICLSCGCDMIITNGNNPANIYNVIDGKPVGTTFTEKAHG